MSYQPHEVAWTPEKVERFWDYYGSTPALRDLYFSAHSGAAIVARAERALRLRGRRALDFGCGRGDLLAHLVARGVRARGLEFSDRSAEAARARLGGEPLFEGVDVAHSLPSGLPPASFDAVFLVEVLEHLLDAQLAPTLDEVRRVLVPDGHVVVTVPNTENLELESVRCPDCGATFHRWQHQRAFGVESLARLLDESGFEARTVEALNWTASRRQRLGARLRRLLGRRGGPHLLYVGSRSAR